MWFSSYGNLLETVRAFVDEADSGFTASELESLLHVECKRALLKLYARARMEGVYVYLARHRGTQRQQKGRRQEHTATEDIAPQVEALSHELRAAIVLFFSLLDERRSRLYAGLEAQIRPRRRSEKPVTILPAPPNGIPSNTDSSPRSARTGRASLSSAFKPYSTTCERRKPSPGLR